MIAMMIATARSTKTYPTAPPRPAKMENNALVIQPLKAASPQDWMPQDTRAFSVAALVAQVYNDARTVVGAYALARSAPTSKIAWMRWIAIVMVVLARSVFARKAASEIAILEPPLTRWGIVASANNNANKEAVGAYAREDNAPKRRSAMGKTTTATDRSTTILSLLCAANNKGSALAQNNNASVQKVGKIAMQRIIINTTIGISPMSAFLPLTPLIMTATDRLIRFVLANKIAIVFLLSSLAFWVVARFGVKGVCSGVERMRLASISYKTRVIAAAVVAAVSVSIGDVVGAIAPIWRKKKSIAALVINDVRGS
jgi:hypothetical protein